MTHIIVRNPMPKVVHLVFPDRLAMTLALARFQEFYESPYDNIRGQPFSMAEFINTYADRSGMIDYFLKWKGFNFPTSNILAFCESVQELHHYELEVMQVLDDAEYVIATDSANAALDHEIAHALYYLNESYRHEMNVQINLLDYDVRVNLNQNLILGQYPDDLGILDDEIQAYLSSDDLTELMETFPSFSLQRLSHLRAPFRSIKEKYI